MLLNLCSNSLAEIILFLAISYLFVKFGWFFLHEFYVHVFGSLNLKRRLSGYGQWAVVTGSTRGLGVKFCEQLAEQGLNLVLIARNEKLLKEQAKDLEHKYSIKTHYLIADFNRQVDENFLANFLQPIKDKDIGILVNNAGVMYDFPDLFHNIENEVLSKIVNVNVIWPLNLCHYIVKEIMMKKKKGLVVFLSSAAGKCNTPLLTVYGASKAFIYYVSKCLSVEYSCTGLHFQVITPYYVATDMTQYNKQLNTPGFFNPSSECFVKSAVRTFGMTSETTGFFPHALMSLSMSLWPEFISDYLLKYWQLYLKKQV